MTIHTDLPSFNSVKMVSKTTEAGLIHWDRWSNSPITKKDNWLLTADKTPTQLPLLRKQKHRQTHRVTLQLYIGCKPMTRAQNNDRVLEWSFLPVREGGSVYLQGQLSLQVLPSEEVCTDCCSKPGIGIKGGLDFMHCYKFGISWAFVWKIPFKT